MAYKLNIIQNFITPNIWLSITTTTKSDTTKNTLQLGMYWRYTMMLPIVSHLVTQQTCITIGYVLVTQFDVGKSLHIERYKVRRRWVCIGDTL